MISESGILSLAELLGGGQQDPNSAPKTPGNALANPGSIGPSQAQIKVKQAEEEKKKKAEKDIWDEDEVEEVVDTDDGRPQPEYTVTFRQKVSSEDMYLQMNGKNPSIEHSDEIVVKIYLPDEKLKDIQLTCTTNMVDQTFDAVSTGRGRQEWIGKVGKR
ncbi:Protein pih1d3 [Blyttiomyces sp. JEL0837]|nr:Protein pih1d3 [Blyttiomyces sp. JEL0837]